MAANSRFDSIPQTNHVQPWEESHLILNPSLRNDQLLNVIANQRRTKCWQEILQ